MHYYAFIGAAKNKYKDVLAKKEKEEKEERERLEKEKQEQEKVENGKLFENCFCNILVHCVFVNYLGVIYVNSVMSNNLGLVMIFVFFF